MIATLSMAEARAQFTQILGQFEKEPELVVQVTRHGRPVMAVLSWERYESLIETLAVMSDPALMAAIRASERDIANGRTRDWAAVKADLGL